MRIWRIAQEEDEDEDLLQDAIKEVGQPGNVTIPVHVSRTLDESGYIRRDEAKFKCSSVSGWSVDDVEKTAALVHADAVALAEGFRDAGFVAQHPHGPKDAILYSGFGAIYVKCVVAVRRDDANGEMIYQVAKGLGVKA